MRLLLLLTAIVCLVFGAGFGYLLSEYHFPRATAFEPSEALRISSGSEVGVLPRGTSMHYRSRDRDHVKFYVFVRVPIDQATLLIKPASTDRESDNRYLEATP